MTVRITPGGTAASKVKMLIHTESLVMIGASGLAGAEEVSVSVDDGVGGEVGVVLETVPLVLDTTNNVTHLRGPGIYFLQKPVTAGDAHVFMFPPARSEVEVITV